MAAYRSSRWDAASQSSRASSRMRRGSVSPAAAARAIRRVSGTQLDPVVVDVFIEMIERHGVAFRHTDEADFERELAFERRVNDYARPKVAAA